MASKRDWLRQNTNIAVGNIHGVLYVTILNLSKQGVKEGEDKVRSNFNVNEEVLIYHLSKLLYNE